MENHLNHVYSCIDKRKEEIIEIGDHIYANPETGYKEFKTSSYLSEKLKDIGFSEEKLKGIGFSVQEFGNIPGLKITLDTGREGPGLAVIGELDAVICSDHPHKDQATDAVHACGHNIQKKGRL